MRCDNSDATVEMSLSLTQSIATQPPKVERTSKRVSTHPFGAVSSEYVRPGLLFDLALGVLHDALDLR